MTEHKQIIDGLNSMISYGVAVSWVVGFRFGFGFPPTSPEVTRSSPWQGILLPYGSTVSQIRVSHTVLGFDAEQIGLYITQRLTNVIYRQKIKFREITRFIASFTDIYTNILHQTENYLTLKASCRLNRTLHFKTINLLINIFPFK